MIPKHIIELIKNFKNLHNEFNSETYKQLKNRIKLNFLSRKELSNYLNEQLKKTKQKGSEDIFTRAAHKRATRQRGCTRTVYAQVVACKQLQSC